MPGSCFAPGASGTHGIRPPENNSELGFALSNAPSSSITPTLTTLFGPNVSPVLNSVEPQSPQKWLVIVFPPSAVLAYVFGFPSTLKPSPGMIAFVEYVLPVIF